MTTQRALSPFETGYFSASARFGSVPVAGMPLFIGSVVRGTVDAGLLRRVLAELAAVHPLLRCRVTTENALVFRLQEDFRPRLDVTEGGDDAYLRLLNSPQDWTTGLFRGHLLRDGSSSRVVLVIHHGIADGRSAFPLLDEMWRRYTALASGTGGLPAPVESRLPDAVDTRLASVVPDAEVTGFLDLVARAATGGGPAPAMLRPDGDGTADDPLGRFALDRVELDTGTTGALLTTARAHGLTVNALLCGAVLNCASGLGTMLAVDAGADPVALAREVAADVRAALARRDPARFLLASQRVRSEAAAALGARPTIAVSNVGRIPRHPAPAGLSVVRDEAYAMAVGMPPKLSAFTYDGRLTVQVEYDTAVHGRERMGRLGRDLEAALRKIARTPAPAVAAPGFPVTTA